MKIVSALAIVAVSLLALGGLARADVRPPYAGTPKVGDAVRLDGTAGGQNVAWAYVDRSWLERYLQMTIDAAAANRPYDDAQVQNRLSTIANHVSPVPNGTAAVVEEVAAFAYGGKSDVEARVMIVGGPLRGRELWTTCAELVDSAGHPFLRM